MHLHGLTNSGNRGGRRNANQPVGIATRPLSRGPGRCRGRSPTSFGLAMLGQAAPLSDVVGALEGGPCEVPANEHVQAFISADDAQFRVAARKIRAARREERDEQLASAVVSRLKRPIKTEKTVAEYRQHADWMIRVATKPSIHRKHSTLRAAAEAQPDAEGAKAVSYFIRMRPQDGAADALRQFQAALRDYQQDSRSLEPLTFGNRTLQSLQTSDDGAAIPASLLTHVFSQRMREVRAVSRSLLSRIALLRSAISPAMADRLENTPLESALTVLDQAGLSRPREKVCRRDARSAGIVYANGIRRSPRGISGLRGTHRSRAFKTSADHSPDRSASYDAPVLDLLPERRQLPPWKASDTTPASSRPGSQRR